MQRVGEYSSHKSTEENPNTLLWATHSIPFPQRHVPNPQPSIRVLLMADSHLGFDLPTHPRVERRRRGHNFLANHERALAPALAGEVDLVVHGGDVFHRSRVPPSLVYQAFQPLVEIAESGVPVFVVPGNHERSRIPHDRFAAHPNLHIFHRPETVLVEAQRLRVAVAGFPYQRRGIRERFPQVLEETGWSREETDIRLLCMHHCVEGARVGPAGYTFRRAPDVVRCSDLPTSFAAVLSGHIHRHQVLRRDLNGRPMPTPALYPGSVERTAFAERDEDKGFILLELEPGRNGGRLARHDFVPLPARPMLVRELHPRAEPGAAWPPGQIVDQLTAALAGIPNDAVIRVRVHGRVPAEDRAKIAPSRLRHLYPTEMNLELRLVEDQASRRMRGPSPRGRRSQRTRQVHEAALPPTQPGLWPQGTDSPT